MPRDWTRERGAESAGETFAGTVSENLENIWVAFCVDCGRALRGAVEKQDWNTCRELVDILQMVKAS